MRAGMVNFLLTAWVPNDAPAIRRPCSGAFAVTRIKTIAIAMGVMAAAAALAGCASAPPFSVEEQLWFDKATGADITHVPPGLRMVPPPGYVYPGQLPSPFR
jgi:hypothetical protein